MAHGPIEPQYHGVMAEFETPEQVMEAAEKTRSAGYKQFDCYSPFPIHGLSDAMGVEEAKVPWAVFIGGFIGALSGMALQIYVNSYDYPMNVGGRDDLSWPYFIPVTFEVTILFAAFSALLSMLGLNGLPRPHHPVFNVPEFARASTDRFFLCIEAQDPKFDLQGASDFLKSLNPLSVSPVSND